MDTDDDGRFHQNQSQDRDEPRGIRFHVLLLLFLPLLVMVLGAAYIRGQRGLGSERARLAAETQAAEQEHDEAVELERQDRRHRVREGEAAHRLQLGNKRLLSGELARLAHAAEWRRRIDQDPELARSPLETTLLRMKRLGSDSTLAAVEALEQVAQLASPPGSRIEVMPHGTGFNVRVAFKLSAISEKESGGNTAHRTIGSLRREIETVSARLIRQVFDYCGSRGIGKISVSCNRSVRESPVPEGATAAERDALVGSSELVMRSVFRLSIPGTVVSRIGDWRALPESDVLRLATVEKDGLNKMTISGRTSRASQDPDMPLEF